MNADAVMKAMEGLRKPLQQAIQMAAVMQPKGDLSRLAQMIIGPERSGKTTEAVAYANALAQAELVPAKEPVSIYGGQPQSAAEWREIFKSAEGGVLIVDDIYKYDDPDKGRRSVLEDLIFLSYEDPKHVLILTGDKEPMEKFLEGLSLEARGRLRPPVETERTFGADEIHAYHRKKEEERRTREHAAEVARCKDEWHQMSEDVTLKKPAVPMKGIVLVRKNDTVS